jgi:N-dimethylarginine dimethylaminohydrolase
MVHTRVSEDLPAPQDLPDIPRPTNVLLTTPEYFQVEYAINPHMEGNLGAVDPNAAREQWDDLRETYQRLGFTVHVLPGVPGLPDMVFCANQTLPYRTPRGEQGVILGRMRAPQRRGEVQYYERFFGERDYEVHSLDPDVRGDFEGMGDAVWHPGKYLLWGAHGFRTDIEVLERISSRFGIPIVALRLEDPDFYHLDTCLTPLDETTALIFPGAFDEDGLELIHHCFEHIIEAPEDEARSLLAGNAACPDSQHVIIQRGCDVTNARLTEAGFEVVEVETSEFLKAGGSVFCMKLMFW